MKIIKKLLSCISILVILLTACHPDGYKSVGVPKDQVTSLTGTWKLAKVIQTDEDSKRKGFPYQQIDLTNLFPYTDFRLTFNTNGSAPTTFTTVPGNSPRVIRLTSGNWAPDDPAYPKVLTLTNATDTAKVTLGSYPAGFSPVLKITQERRDASGKLLISYSYEFIKQ